MSKESEIEWPVHWQDNKVQGKELQPVEENRPAYKCNLLDFMDILWRLWVFFSGCGSIAVWRGDPKRTTQPHWRNNKGTVNDNVDRKKCCLIKSDSVLGSSCRHSLWFSGGLIWWRWFIFSITAQPSFRILSSSSTRWHYNWLKCRQPVLSSKGDMPKGLLLFLVGVEGSTEQTHNITCRVGNWIMGI